MRTGLFLFLIGLSHCLTAQRRDSLLSEVIVYGMREEKFLHGSTVITIDSTLRAHENSRHLGEVLSLQLPIYFRNYGSGMISSISMRGTSPQHTAVLWNGININSFSLGQADFSILPSFAFGDVRVHSGGGSSRFGSGAFGGTVLLSSANEYEQPKISFTQEVGSFGRHFTAAKGNYNSGSWSFSTSVYRLTSENNFLVLSTGERQQHASFNQSGFLQSATFHFSASKIISLNYWYHSSNREIQPTIGQQNSQDNQQDKSHRLSINYKSNSLFGLFVLNGGYINDEIVFDGNKGIVERWISSARQNFNPIKKIQTQIGAEWNHIIGNIPDYQNGKAQEDRFDFLLSFESELSNRISWSLNFRQPHVTGFSAPFLPYAGIDYRLIRKELMQLKLNANISKNYRVPTLNDRYWQSAGDVNLLPETSHSAETGWSFIFKTIEISNKWFTQRIDQWIQWVPESNGSYHPQNVQQVLAEGFDFNLKGKIILDKLIITPSLAYQFTKSVATQAPASQQYVINKQLIYTPQHTATGYLQLSLAKYSGDVSAQYNGQRFTDAGNSETYALPAFILFNASIGKYWLLDQHRMDLRLAAKNILNTDYQLYSGRAMPGRNFSIQLNYQLNQNQK